MFSLLGAAEQPVDFMNIGTAFVDVRASNFTSTQPRSQGIAINDDYFAAIMGTQAAPQEYLGLYDEDGALQDSIQYTEDGGSTPLMLYDVASDGEANYLISQLSNERFILISTSKDGLTVNWARLLRTGSDNLQTRSFAITVNASHVYFGVEIITSGTATAIVGQVDKNTGVLNWARVGSPNPTPGTVTTVVCNDTYVAILDSEVRNGFIVFDSSGTVVYRKGLSNFTTSGILGFDIDSTHLYVTMIDKNDNEYLVTLKFTLSTGTIAAQKKYTITSTDGDKQGTPYLQNLVSVTDNYVYNYVLLDEANASALVYRLNKTDLSVNNVRTQAKSGQDITPWSIKGDNDDGLLVSGTRNDGTNDDFFFAGVVFDETNPTGWGTDETTPTEITPTYSLTNLSYSFASYTFSQNQTDATTAASVTDITSDSW